MEDSPLSNRLSALHSEHRAQSRADRDRRTNRACLAAVRDGATRTAREAAALDLRRRCRALCAATIARRAHGLTADAIEDLTQDVMLRLLASPAGTDPSPAYIETIAAHVLIDQHRHRARRGLDGTSISLDDPEATILETLPDPGAGTESVALEHAAEDHLLRAIRALLRPRDVEIVLRRADGDPHERIAADLGLAVPHVRKLAERALRRLREASPALIAG
ncbi:MAG: RNA polymerase sigma factor [Armatimonadota bacterium]